MVTLQRVQRVISGRWHVCRAGAGAVYACVELVGAPNLETPQPHVPHFEMPKAASASSCGMALTSISGRSGIVLGEL